MIIADTNVPMLLVLNKYDLVDEKIKEGQPLEEFQTLDYLDEFAKDNKFIGGMTTSAKYGQGVIEAISCLVRNILIGELTMEQNS